MEQQTADREANLEEKIAKVNSYLSYLSPSIGDFDEKMIPPESYNTISVQMITHNTTKIAIRWLFPTLVVLSFEPSKM